MALISVSLALSQTPVYTATPWMRGWCTVYKTLRSSFHWYWLLRPQAQMTWVA